MNFKKPWISPRKLLLRHRLWINTELTSSVSSSGLLAWYTVFGVAYLSGWLKKNAFHLHLIWYDLAILFVLQKTCFSTEQHKPQFSHGNYCLVNKIDPALIHQSHIILLFLYSQNRTNAFSPSLDMLILVN